MARYLVLGGSGYIGSALVKYLQLQNHKVDVLDIQISHTQDLTRLKIQNLNEYHACFFLAWNVGGSKYLQDTSTWPDQFQENIGLINNIFPQLKLAGIPYLFVSSQLAGMDESPYSLTKFVAEKYCQTMPNSVVARQWNAYGSVERLDVKSHVLSDLIHQAISNGRIDLLTDGQEKRKFVHLSDICDAYLSMINFLQGSIFDVSAGQYVSILEIAEIISNFTGAKIFPGIHSGSDPKVQEYETVPNWHPKVPLEVGILELINSYKEQNK